MNNIKLRPYQQKSIEQTRESILKGQRKVLIWLNTGAGKSVIFKKITADTIANGKKVLLVMRRRDLIFQTKKHIEAIGHKPSIIMGTEKGFDSSNVVQICSIDTIRARIDDKKYQFLKKYDLIILDEAHDCTSPSYMKFFDFVDDGKKIFVGLTATPFKIGKKVHDFWDNCVQSITSKELKDQGYLTDARLFAPQVKINTSNLKVQATGDYKTSEVFDIMSDLNVIGDVIQTYEKYGQDKPAILFAVNIRHSELMAAEFNLAGIPAIHCDQSSSSKERESAINKLRKGEIKILCNVNIFSTGVDIPEAEVGIMARPTASEVLYIQQLGRLLRPCKKCARCGATYGAENQCYSCGYNKASYEKPHAIILDHGDNSSRFGLPFRPRVAHLKEEKKEGKSKKESVPQLAKDCPECFAILDPKEIECPYCGYEFKKVSTEGIEHLEGDLQELTEELYNKKRLLQIKCAFEDLKFQQRLNGWKPNAVYFKLYERFGEDMFMVEKLKDKKWVAKYMNQNH